MAFIEWNEKFSVHVPEIDSQHRRLIEIINRLHEVVKTGGAGDQILAGVDQLVLSFRNQFVREEELMKNINYPGLANHARSHCAMMMQLDAFRGEIAIGHIHASMKLMHFLRAWLINHIFFADTEYRRHMSSMPCAGMNWPTEQNHRI